MLELVGGLTHEKGQGGVDALRGDVANALVGDAVRPLQGGEVGQQADGCQRQQDAEEANTRQAEALAIRRASSRPGEGRPPASPVGGLPRTDGGANGVGKSTTASVVVSCIAILCLNYILATLLL